MRRWCLNCGSRAGQSHLWEGGGRESWGGKELGRVLGLKGQFGGWPNQGLSQEVTKDQVK